VLGILGLQAGPASASIWTDSGSRAYLRDPNTGAVWAEGTTTVDTHLRTISVCLRLYAATPSIDRVSATARAGKNDDGLWLEVTKKLTTAEAGNSIIFGTSYCSIPQPFTGYVDLFYTHVSYKQSFIGSAQILEREMAWGDSTGMAIPRWAYI